MFYIYYSLIDTSTEKIHYYPMLIMLYFLYFLYFLIKKISYKNNAIFILYFRLILELFLQYLYFV